MRLLRRRGVLVLLVVLGALVVVVTASRTWLTGAVDDVVLGQISRGSGEAVERVVQ